MNTTLTLADIRAAHARIADKIHRTPVLTSATLDALCGAQLFFKCENFQKIGAFKARGATNAVFALTDAEAANGVATHSSGNHAAALARAAHLRGIPAHIVMPSNAPKTKIESVRRNGGIIVFCEPTLVAREAACAKIIAETGARLVHPFDDYAVMAGQGTATLEMLEDAPAIEALVIPVGGGGLCAGAAIAAAERLGAAGTVLLCEATAHPLAKVRISGGGRCNVTHDCMDPRELVKRYPRGGRELLGAFHRFGPRDTIAWFAERGVTLKTEADGRRN